MKLTAIILILLLAGCVNAPVKVGHESYMIHSQAGLSAAVTAGNEFCAVEGLEFEMDGYQTFGADPQ